ncbi:MAG: L-rhamnose mutarotase [Brachybacterium sp.]|uniref:L-rhamnose mutarotase n=1 Tax=Brachybacterium sp. TaxID=1891286 RepID=UPI002656DC17|nr:L-rhamnose mutarotase [Brachybacterium sp.]MDN6303526.1 L-rhamnose mutarotase [Brachybacterium sp.]MDN6328010.1 L-rhamnose mutarotase [Brachybacterium sp.]
MSTPDLDHLLATSTARSPHRCCFLLHVRPEKLPEYVAAHQEVWEEMREALTAAGWRNYSLFLRPEDGMVVGYFEAEDVDAAQDAISRAGISPRWEAAMREYFVPGGGEKQILPQYFHLA